MKLWIDDIRTPPNDTDYVWAKSTNQSIELIQQYKDNIDYIDIDHDAGDYASDGGDFIKILDWLEANEFWCTLRIHSMNPVGRQNMEAIANHNNWRIIK